MPFTTVSGAEIEYLIEGPEDADLIITLHGGRGMGSKESDHATYKALADKYRVLSFDFRGHGNSSATPPYTFARIVDDIEEIKNQFTSAKAIVIGGSFGGFLAQQYAITYPNSLKALVLRGTAASYHHEDDAFESLKLNIHKATNASVDMLGKVFSSYESDEEFRLVMFALGPLYSESYNPDNGLRGILKTKFNAESHNSLYSEEEKYFDYRKDLPFVNVPTLIVVGSNDWICPPKQSRIIDDLLPNSELFEVEGANHGVHKDQKVLVLNKIRSFLEKAY